MRLAKQLPVIVALTAFYGCAAVQPFTATPQRASMDDDEKSVWEASSQQDATFANLGSDYDDPALQAYVQSIVDKLYPEFEGTIHVHLLKSTVPNAFMMANGSCYVQLGILPLLHDEAQLAIVLGHEGIHFTNRHGYLEHNHAIDSVVAGVLFGAVIPILPIAMAYSSIAGYSVQMESQADQQGYARFLKAGYDPEDTPAPFEALDQYTTSLQLKQGYFFADHPKLQTRIAYFKAQAAKAGPGGVRGQTDYLQTTQQARLWTLQESSARQEYKTRSAEYPAYAQYYLGQAYGMRNDKGDDAHAEAVFRGVITKAPDFAPTYAALGEALMRRGGDDAEAASLLLTYLKLAPNAVDRGYVEAYIKRLTSTSHAQQNSTGN